MHDSTDQSTRQRRRLAFGLSALVASITIAILVKTGVAEPYPNLRQAYLLCVVVGVIGLIQILVALIGWKRT